MLNIQQEFPAPVGVLEPKAVEILGPVPPIWKNRLDPEPDANITLRAKIYSRDVKFEVGLGPLIGKRDLRPRMIEIQGEDGKRKLPIPHGSRGVITHFSTDSSRRLRLLIRNTADKWQSFLTLTYPREFPTNGPATKRDLHVFCSWLSRQQIAYCWILEFQERGAPHYHFLLSGYVSKDRIAEKWHSIVASGSTKIDLHQCDRRPGSHPVHLCAGTRVEAVKNPDQVGAYMAAYMSKLDQKGVPETFRRVGRFWGASRCLTAVVMHLEAAYSDVKEVLAPYVEKNRAIRLKWSEKYSTYAEPWRWAGYGFLLIGGTDFFRETLRQALDIDRGLAWKDGDGKKDRPPGWSPPVPCGQLLLDGGIDEYVYI